MAMAHKLATIAVMACTVTAFGVTGAAPVHASVPKTAPAAASSKCHVSVLLDRGDGTHSNRVYANAFVQCHVPAAYIKVAAQLYRSGKRKKSGSRKCGHPTLSCGASSKTLGLTSKTHEYCARASAFWDDQQPVAKWSCRYL